MTGTGTGDTRRLIDGDVTGTGSGDARGPIDGDEGGEPPCLAHVVDDPPALAGDQLAQLVARLADATSRASGEASTEVPTGQPRPAPPTGARSNR